MCTESLVRYVYEQVGAHISHLAWEYDGIGINEDCLTHTRPTFLNDAEDHVFKETGYRMHIAKKTERSVLDILRSLGSALSSGSSSADVGAYVTPGNCIRLFRLRTLGPGRTEMLRPTST